MIELYAANVSNNINDNVFNKLSSHVSEEKRNRIKKFINRKDAIRTIVGEILVRYAICNKLKIKNENIIFSKNEFGKPFLKNYGDFNFNISHSGNWVMCGISSLTIGIDIEEVKETELEIAKQFFAPEEYKLLMLRPKNERLSFFFGLWTIKESYIKAVGKGLYIPLNSFFVNGDSNIIQTANSNEANTYYYQQYNINTNYKLAICSIENTFPKELRVINFSQQDNTLKIIELVEPLIFN